MEITLEIEKYVPTEGKPGYVHFDKMCTLGEFKSAIEEYLKGIILKVENQDDYSVYDWLDYFSFAIFDSVDETPLKDRQMPRFRWLYCFVCKGGSEGHYFHIDSMNNEGKTTQLFIAKTLSEKMDIALQINNYMNEFILKALDNI